MGGQSFPSSSTCSPADCLHPALPSCIAWTSLSQLLQLSYNHISRALIGLKMLCNHNPDYWVVRVFQDPSMQAGTRHLLQRLWGKLWRSRVWSSPHPRRLLSSGTTYGVCFLFLLFRSLFFRPTGNSAVDRRVALPIIVLLWWIALYAVGLYYFAKAIDSIVRKEVI